MNNAPKSERLHIGIFGKRNSGKSSLMNAITGQTASLVSDVPGTTADPVNKAMEIPSIGPCLLIDTAGFDDDAGGLGEMRVNRTMKALERIDMAILIFRDCDDTEKEWFKILRDRKIPVIPVLNIFQEKEKFLADKTERHDKTQHTSDNAPSGQCRNATNGHNEINGCWTGVQNIEAFAEKIPADKISAEKIPIEKILAEKAPAEEIYEMTGEKPVEVNARTGENVQAIFSSVLRKLPENYGTHTITGNLVKEGDTVMLVMPQDSQAPKGRLILPQVQTIRELIDRRCTVVGCTPDRIREALQALASPPQLIITDSQAFSEAWAAKPEESRLTSFSILFAGYKGDISAFMDGTGALDRLTEDSRVLIAEACTHAPATEDIGRVKIPHMLRQRIGQGLRIDIVSGTDFPEDLSGYDLVIHCGACMFNRRYVLNRIASAASRHIPVTNYGLTIAWAKGILDKLAIPDREQ